jgi:hypothetical protein
LIIEDQDDEKQVFDELNLSSNPQGIKMRNQEEVKSR